MCQGQNLALGEAARQSSVQTLSPHLLPPAHAASVYGPAPYGFGAAAHAVDGCVEDCVFTSAWTAAEQAPWFEVDLAQNESVGEVVVWMHQPPQQQASQQKREEKAAAPVATVPPTLQPTQQQIASTAVFPPGPDGPAASDDDLLPASLFPTHGLLPRPLTVRLDNDASASGADDDAMPDALQSLLSPRLMRQLSTIAPTTVVSPVLASSPPLPVPDYYVLLSDQPFPIRSADGAGSSAAAFFEQCKAHASFVGRLVPIVSPSHPRESRGGALHCQVDLSSMSAIVALPAPRARFVRVMYSGAGELRLNQVQVFAPLASDIKAPAVSPSSLAISAAAAAAAAAVAPSVSAASLLDTIMMSSPSPPNMAPLASSQLHMQQASATLAPTLFGNIGPAASSLSSLPSLSSSLSSTYSSLPSSLSSLPSSLHMAPTSTTAVAAATAAGPMTMAQFDRTLMPLSASSNIGFGSNVQQQQQHDTAHPSFIAQQMRQGPMSRGSSLGFPPAAVATSSASAALVSPRRKDTAGASSSSGSASSSPSDVRSLVPFYIWCSLLNSQVSLELLTFLHRLCEKRGINAMELNVLEEEQQQAPASGSAASAPSASGVQLPFTPTELLQYPELARLGAEVYNNAAVVKLNLLVLQHFNKIIMAMLPLIDFSAPVHSTTGSLSTTVAGAGVGVASSSPSPPPPPSSPHLAHTIRSIRHFLLWSSKRNVWEQSLAATVASVPK